MIGKTSSHVNIIFVFLLLVQDDQILQFFLAGTGALAVFLFLALALLFLRLAHLQVREDEVFELLFLLAGGLILFDSEAKGVDHLNLVFGAFLALRLLLLYHLRPACL